LTGLPLIRGCSVRPKTRNTLFFQQTSLVINFMKFLRFYNNCILGVINWKWKNTKKYTFFKCGVSLKQGKQKQLHFCCFRQHQFKISRTSLFSFNVLQVKEQHRMLIHRKCLLNDVKIKLKQKLSSSLRLLLLYSMFMVWTTYTNMNTSNLILHIKICLNHRNIK